MPTTDNKTRHKKNPQWGEHGVYISKGNSKMGNVPSFSTLPGSTCASGIPCRDGCYAVKLARIFKTFRATLEANTQAVKEGRYGDISADVSAYLDAHPKVSLFRWNVSGDIYDAGFLGMMASVAKKHPGVTFMAFTKQYGLVPVDRDTLPANLRIVLSAWKKYRPADILTAKYPVAYYDDGTPECGVPSNAFHCQGDCERCQRCFKIDVGESVYFTKH